ncbi:MAG: hypothetical protein KGZ85_01570 [Ignavibacterium sp.]|nr:hypothetical protein [Ignavibacterium sp.]
MDVELSEIEKLFAPEHIKLRNKVLDKYKNLSRNSKSNSKEISSKVDWLKIYKAFESNFEKLYKVFNLTATESALFGNKVYFKKAILQEIIDKLFLRLLDDHRKKSKNKLNEEIIKKIELHYKIYYLQHYIEKLDKDNLKRFVEKSKNDLERLKKYTGKKYSKGNLELYKRIYEKNDEYVEKDGEGNYSKAVRVIMKSSNQWEAKYKAFNKFKNSKKIYTLEDFKKFLSTIH